MPGAVLLQTREAEAAQLHAQLEMVRDDSEEQRTQWSALLRQAEQNAQKLRGEVMTRERSNEAMAEDLRRAHGQIAQLSASQARMMSAAFMSARACPCAHAEASASTCAACACTTKWIAPRPP